MNEDSEWSERDSTIASASYQRGYADAQMAYSVPPSGGLTLSWTHVCNSGRPVTMSGPAASTIACAECDSMVSVGLYAEETV